jgi:hypothetical protein
MARKKRDAGEEAAQYVKGLDLVVPQGNGGSLPMRAGDQEIARLPEEMALGRVRAVPTGLVIPEDLTEQEYESTLGFLGTVAKRTQWWVADLFRFGEQHGWGEKYTEALAATEYNLGTLRNIAWVSSVFSLSRRHDKLSFSHHQEAASLDPQDQDYWLGRAEEEKWSARRLREEIRADRMRRAKEENRKRFEEIVQDFQSRHHIEVEQTPVGIPVATYRDERTGAILDPDALAGEVAPVLPAFDEREWRATERIEAAARGYVNALETEQLPEEPALRERAKQAIFAASEATKRVMERIFPTLAAVEKGQAARKDEQ